MGELLRNVLANRRAAISDDEDDGSGTDSDDDVGSVAYVAPPPIAAVVPGVFEAFKDTYVDKKLGGAKKTTGVEIIDLFRQDPMIKQMFDADQIEKLMGAMCLKGLQGKSADDLEITLTVWQGNTLNARVGFRQGYMDINVKCRKPAKDGDPVAITEIHRHRTEITSRDNAAANFTLPLVMEQVIAAAKMKPPVPVTSDSIRDAASGAFGYNVWPKMGFNAPIPKKLSDRMIAFCDGDVYEAFLNGADDLAGSFLVQNAAALELADLFLTEGQLFAQLGYLWRECGDTISTEFDTSSPDSKSFQVLKKYIALKNPKPQVKVKKLPEEEISNE